MDETRTTRATAAPPRAAALERVVLVAAPNDPLEAALRAAGPAVACVRVDGPGALLDGLLRGSDWDAAAVVAAEPSRTADTLVALRDHDPRLPVMVVVAHEAASEEPLWRALGARLVLPRDELRDPVTELRAIAEGDGGVLATPEPRDAADARVLADAAVGALRAAGAADGDGAWRRVAESVRQASGADLVEVWRPAGGGGPLRAGPVATDDPQLARLHERLDAGARPRDRLTQWVYERARAATLDDLTKGPDARDAGEPRERPPHEGPRSAAPGPRFRRRDAALAAGLRTIHALPVTGDGREAPVAAVLLLAWRDPTAARAGAARAAWLLGSLSPAWSWRRRAEAASRRDALVDRALLTVRDGVAACDAEGRLTLRNRAAERLGFGGRVGDPADRWRETWRLGELDGRPVAAGADPLTRALQGETLAGLRLTGESNAGRQRPVEIDAEPVRDDAGTIRGAVVVLRDAAPEAAASAEVLAASRRALVEFRGLLDRAADLAAVLGEASGNDGLWGPLDGFLRATTPANGWRVRAADGRELVRRLLGDAARPRLTQPLRVGPRDLGVLELYAPDATALDERHATAALVAGNLLAVALDHADLVVEERALRARAEESARRLRALFDATPAAVAVVALEDDEVLDVNVALTRMVGRERERLLRRRTGEVGIVLDPDDRAAIVDAAREGRGVRDREVRCRHDDGRVLRCLLASEPTDHGGRPALLVTMLDVTDRLEREAQLAQLANFREVLMSFVEETLVQGFEGAFYQRLVEAAVRATPGAEAGSLLLRDEHDAHRFAAAVGYEESTSDALGEDARRTRAIAASLTVPIHLDGRRVATLTLDAFRDPRAFDGASQQLAAAFAAQAATLVKRRSLERELERMAYHDALTGLPNRALLRDRLGQAVARAIRTGRGGAALFLDLDNLKVTNDTLGHSVGDALLMAVAQRLRLTVRADDTVARVGGDEFVVLLHEVRDVDVTAQVADKVLAALRAPFDIAGHEVHASASMGIVLFPADAVDADLLVQHGDTAMYQAKAQGKDRFRFFTREMNRALLERAALEAQLRKALERDELTLHFQPRAALHDGRITSVEALARWRHPERGWVPPSAFIPVAEDAGLIDAVGHRLLERACRQARDWVDAGCGTVVAFNLSAKQLQERDIVAQVEDALARAGLAGRWLELELTESAVMRNVEENVGKLAALRRLGVHVSIDDFGTAYSSLNYLKRLPASALKIDRSFVVDLGDDPEGSPHDAGIVRAVIALAHTLGMQAIAEGIETPAQLSFLRDAGCDQGQGFLFARPAPVDEVTACLRAGRLPWPPRGE